MAVNLLHKEKTDRKFRFVEDFQEEGYIPKAREEDEEEEKEEITLTSTNFFGERELHQIARVEWKEIVEYVEVEKVLPNGKTETETERIVWYQEVMGEVGGWVESEENLSQKGDCWIEKDAKVVGSARVYEDAMIKEKAEVGDSARVYGKAEIRDSVGIGGTASVSEEAVVRGNKRIAVFGSAAVFGKSEIIGDSKVYGYARVGKHKEFIDVPIYDENGKYVSSIHPEDTVRTRVSGKARVYGEAQVFGTVDGQAEVYGHAIVEGVVLEKSHVGGNAKVGENGIVEGEVRVLRGEVYGTVGGGPAIINYPIFFLDEYAYFYPKGEKVPKEKMSEDEKDKTEDRDTDRYEGEVKSLLIYRGSRVNDCEFRGNVKLYGCNVTGCEIEDSVVGYRERVEYEYYSYGYLNYMYAQSSRWVNQKTFFSGSNRYGEGELYVPAPEFEARNCKISGSIIPEGNYSSCEIKRSIVTKHYSNLSSSDIEYHIAKSTFSHSASDCKMEDCALLNDSHVVNGCELKGVTVESIGLFRKKISDSMVIETSGDYGKLFLWDTYYKDYEDDKNTKLIQENEYKDDRGENKWGDFHGVERLNGIATVALVYESLADYEFAEADRSPQFVYLKESLMLAQEMAEGKKRFAWFDEEVENLKKKAKELKETGTLDGDFEEYFATSKLVDYLEGALPDNFYFLSEESAERFKEAVMKTIESFDGKTYVPIEDYGELTLSPAIMSMAEKRSLRYWMRIPAYSLSRGRDSVFGLYSTIE